MFKRFCAKVLVFVMLFGIVFTMPLPNASAQTSQGNDHPIVMVHGLGGWGPGEMLGFRYWGGVGDIIGHLRGQGFTVFEASVSGWGSNRNRAIELYYFIRGGTVDYGAAHAAMHGHERFGRTFPGVFPEWSEENKVHIIGHSMGGLTARALSNLIAEGCAIEREFHERHPELGIAPLFFEAEQMIHSITTVGTPHNGASFAEDRNAFIHFARDLTLGLAALSGIAPNIVVYDLGMDHFGLSRQPRETFGQYVRRVFQSPVWHTEAVALHCLSVSGITQNAQLLQTRPDIYYFSHTAQATERIPFTNNQRIIATMNPFFMPPSRFIIRYTDYRSDPQITSAWAPNDGMVSVVSSLHPFGHPARPYCGRPVPGEWNFHPVMMRWDHLDIVGIGTRLPREVNQLYLQMARRVQNLPA